MMLKKLYRQLPFNIAQIPRRVYHFITRIYYNYCNVFKYGTKDMFHEINIETSTYCNRRCSYCPNSVFDRGLKKNEKLMSENIFRKIIDELSKINFAGRISPHLYGEPLLDKRLPELMMYAHKKLLKAKIEIYTNGDFLNKEIIERFYDSGVKFYLISLHETGREKQKKIDNLHLFEKFMKNRGKDIEFDILDISNAPLYTRAGLVKVKEVNKEPPCSFSALPLVINYNGDVVLCCNDYFGEVSFGNLNQESIIKIWNKPKFKKIRKELENKVYRLKICKRCNKK